MLRLEKLGDGVNPALPNAGKLLMLLWKLLLVSLTEQTSFWAQHYSTEWFCASPPFPMVVDVVIVMSRLTHLVQGSYIILSLVSV